MTCIVGFKKDNQIWMGADSAGSAGYRLRIRVDEKVFKKGNMLFGFTSSFRMGQLLRYSFNIPEHDTNKKSDYEYLCTDFIVALLKCFETHKYAEVKDNVAKGGFFILGYKRNLYSIESDFQVGKEEGNFVSIGCGDDYAMGAFYAMSLLSIPPREKVLMALKASEKYSNYVKRPFKIISMKQK